MQWILGGFVIINTMHRLSSSTEDDGWGETHVVTMCQDWNVKISHTSSEPEVEEVMDAEWFQVLSCGRKMGIFNQILRNLHPSASEDRGSSVWVACISSIRSVGFIISWIYDLWTSRLLGGGVPTWRILWGLRTSRGRHCKDFASRKANCFFHPLHLSWFWFHLTLAECIPMATHWR